MRGDESHEGVPDPMDLAVWALVAGAGWASGLNLYLVIALLSGAGRLGLLDTPELFLRNDVLIAAIVLTLVEFVADKIPLLDSAWDVVHTAIRPLGAAMMGYAFGGDAPGGEQIAAAVTSGGLALASHLVKATARAAINASPEPVSNIVASVAEDSLVVGVLVLAVLAPVVAIVAVVILLAAGAALATMLASLARRGRQRLRARREQRQGQHGPPPPPPPAARTTNPPTDGPSSDPPTTGSR